MGASLLLASGVHANTQASCSAFTMLVMLGLDARLCPWRAKIILCATSVLAPLFPPKQRSSTRKAKAHNRKTAEALEPHGPEEPVFGGDIICDAPVSLSLPGTGQSHMMTPSVKGHAVARCETVSYPGLNVQWPFSQLILSGVKTVEVRSYALGWRNIARPGVEMWLVETLGDASAISKGWVLQGDTAVEPRPKHAQIVGTVTFSEVEEGSSGRYNNLAEFSGDIKSHRIGSGGKFDWKGEGALYKWRVSAVRRLAQPVPQPGFKGTTGFAQPRPHTVRFIDVEAPTTSELAPSSDAATSSVSLKRVAR